MHCFSFSVTKVESLSWCLGKRTTFTCFLYAVMHSRGSDVDCTEFKFPGYHSAVQVTYQSSQWKPL